MSDSTEVYESRPNPFLLYFIYILMALLVTAVVWTNYSKIDIVVKSNGIFRSKNSIYEISSAVNGKVTKCNVSDGQFVQKGDVLYTLEVFSLGETIKYYQNELENVTERIVILKAYEKSLNSDNNELKKFSNNKYYNEFVNRRLLLSANIYSNDRNTKKEADIYQGKINVLTASIHQYEEKKEKLNKVKKCIVSKKNVFGKEENYYSSIVNAYLSNYNFTVSQYDTQISEQQKKVEKCDKLLKEAVSQNDVSKGDIQEQRKEIELKIIVLKNEKQQALSNLELQQISNIEQQIGSINDAIISLQNNISSTQLEFKALGNNENFEDKEIFILSEKEKIANEILSYQTKKEEYKNHLKGYDIQKDNCKVKASSSGYFYLQQDIKQGSFVQEGAKIGKIYQGKETEFNAEIYVKNSDIAKLQKNQKVKFEIVAYPSSKYGYFTGKIINISKDITIDTESGNAYYLVKATCDKTTIKSKKGKEASIMNGMMFQAKIIVDEENVLTHLLRKIDLLD